MKKLELTRPRVVDEVCRSYGGFVEHATVLNPSSPSGFIRYVFSRFPDEVFSFGELEAAEKPFGILRNGRPVAVWSTLVSDKFAMKNAIRVVRGRLAGRKRIQFGFATRRQDYKTHLEENFGIRIVERDLGVVVGSRPDYEFEVSRKCFHFEADGYAKII